MKLREVIWNELASRSGTCWKLKLSCADTCRMLGAQGVEQPCHIGTTTTGDRDVVQAETASVLGLQGKVAWQEPGSKAPIVTEDQSLAELRSKHAQTERLKLSFEYVAVRLFADAKTPRS